MRPPEEDRKRIARAIWSWSRMDQAQLAKEAGLSHARVRAIFGNDANKTAPSIDELLAMADAAGVPEAFALHGFNDLADVGKLQSRIADLELVVGEQGASISGLELAIEELRSTGRQTTRPGDAQ